MKSEGVDFIVAQPENLEVFENLKSQNLLFQQKQCKWVFALNNRK